LLDHGFVQRYAESERVRLLTACHPEGRISRLLVLACGRTPLGRDQEAEEISNGCWRCATIRCWRNNMNDARHWSAFPQAFSHVALINTFTTLRRRAACRIDAQRRRQIDNFVPVIGQFIGNR
jgi:hypothetical protein